MRTSKPKLSQEFRAWLRDQINRSGFSIYSLAQETDLQQSNLNQGLLGTRDIPDEMLRAIAPHIGLAPERLVILAGLDRLGGIEHVRKHVPELAEPPVEDRVQKGREVIAQFSEKPKKSKLQYRIVGEVGAGSPRINPEFGEQDEPC